MKRAKFGNTKVVNSIGKFDSKREYERYLYLLDLEKSGKIRNLERQVAYELIPPIVEVTYKETKKGLKEIKKTVQRPITYSCDFQYIEDGKLIVEDVKISPKMLPKEYTLKKKMLRYVHGIEIREFYG